MKAAGIICEYNPFHNGHIYHIEKTRALTGCDVVICVMSGNFVQRGEPAIIDKRLRCKAALEHGVDIVIELPFFYAMQSAEQFASGSVQTLALAQVKDIVFGSESNNLTMLNTLAQRTSMDYRTWMNNGCSSAQAHEAADGKLESNDILGWNYLKALKPYPIRAHCIQRTNLYHDTSLNQPFASAQALRKELLSGNDVSSYTPMTFSSAAYHHLDDYYPYLRMLLLTFSSNDLRSLFMMDEGIEQLLKAKAVKCDTLDSFLQATTSKRYSTSRIRRTLIHLLHHTTKQQINTLPPLHHIRILGLNEMGKVYLKTLRKNNDVSVAVRFRQLPLIEQEILLKSAQLYGWPHNIKEAVAQELLPPVQI